jgi:hypothetical protein
MERYTPMYPRGQPSLPDDRVTTDVNNLCVIGTASVSVMTQGGHGPRDAMTPRGGAMSAWPLRRVAPNQSQHHATATPTPSGMRGSKISRRRDASSTRSWPFYAKSSAWMPSPAIDNRRRMFLCRGCPAREMATRASTARLQTSRTAVLLRRRHVGQSPTTTDAPMEVRTLTRTLKLTLRHFSGRRLRTLPLRPCCCAAARSPRPSRSDECASS